jgi:hypothetical protein
MTPNNGFRDIEVVSDYSGLSVARIQYAARCGGHIRKSSDLYSVDDALGLMASERRVKREAKEKALVERLHVAQVQTLTSYITTVFDFGICRKHGPVVELDTIGLRHRSVTSR